MTRDDVNAKVIDIVRGVMRDDPVDVNAASTLTGLGASSLDVIDIKLELERAFGLEEIPEKELVSMVTLGDVADLIAKKLKLF